MWMLKHDTESGLRRIEPAWDNFIQWRWIILAFINLKKEKNICHDLFYGIGKDFNVFKSIFLKNHVLLCFHNLILLSCNNSKVAAVCIFLLFVWILWNEKKLTNIYYHRWSSPILTHRRQNKVIRSEISSIGSQLC